MLLPTGRDVWEGIAKLGWLSGSCDPKTNRQCANADALAALLSQVHGKIQNWLPNLLETEDAIQTSHQASILVSRTARRQPLPWFDLVA
jgi:hypothetical protein